MIYTPGLTEVVALWISIGSSVLVFLTQLCESLMHPYPIKRVMLVLGGSLLATVAMSLRPRYGLPAIELYFLGLSIAGANILWKTKRLARPVGDPSFKD
jgi:hypothetical protein